MPISMSSAKEEQLRRARYLNEAGKHDEALEILTVLYDQDPDKDIMYMLADTLYKLGQKTYSYFMYERIHSIVEYESEEYRALILKIIELFSQEDICPILGYYARVSDEPISQPPSPEDMDKPKFSLAGEEEEKEEEFIEDSDDRWKKFSLASYFAEFTTKVFNDEQERYEKSFTTTDEVKIGANRTVIIYANDALYHGYASGALKTIKSMYIFGLDRLDDSFASTILGDIYNEQGHRAEAVKWYYKAIEYDRLNSVLFLRLLKMGTENRNKILEKAEEVDIENATDGIEIASTLFRYKEYSWSLYFVKKTLEQFPEYEGQPLLLTYAKYNVGDVSAKEEILAHLHKYRAVLPYMLIKRGRLPSKIDVGSNFLPVALLHKAEKELHKLLASKQDVQFTHELKRSIFYCLFDVSKDYFNDYHEMFDDFGPHSKYNEQIKALLLEAINSIRPHFDAKGCYIFDLIRRGYKGPIRIINRAYTYTVENYLPSNIDEYPEFLQVATYYATSLLMSDEMYFNFYDIRDIATKVYEVYNKQGKLPRAITDPFDLGAAMFIYRLDPTFKRRSSRNEYYDYRLGLPVPLSEKLRRAINRVMITEP